MENGDKTSIKLLSDALENHGFFSITQHGLSQELIDKCYKSSKEFFDLDYEIKNTYSSVGSKGARGYTPKGIETAVGEKIADQKEFWHHGPVIDDSYDERIMKNVYVQEIDGFNNFFDELKINLNTFLQNLKDCKSYKLCIVKNSKMKSRYNIMSIPTLVVLNKTSGMLPPTEFPTTTFASGWCFLIVLIHHFIHL